MSHILDVEKKHNIFNFCFRIVSSLATCFIFNSSLCVVNIFVYFQMARATWLFYVAKFVELLDTVSLSQTGDL